MDKKQIKKATAPKKKAAPKKKENSKPVEHPVFAPEATPFVANYEPKVSEPKVSFLDKVKKFLGF
jgi:hypothetical protein